MLHVLLIRGSCGGRPDVGGSAGGGGGSIMFGLWVVWCESVVLL